MACTGCTPETVVNIAFQPILYKKINRFDTNFKNFKSIYRKINKNNAFTKQSKKRHKKNEKIPIPQNAYIQPIGYRAVIAYISGIAQKQAEMPIKSEYWLKSAYSLKARMLVISTLSAPKK